MGASSLQSLPGSVTFMEWGLATSPEMLAGEARISSHRPAQAEGLPENTDHTPWQVEKETDASDRTLCKGRTQEKWKTWSSKGPEVCRAWNVGLVVLHLVLVGMFPGQNSQRNA